MKTSISVLVGNCSLLILIKTPQKSTGICSNSYHLKQNSWKIWAEYQYNDIFLVYPSLLAKTQFSLVFEWFVTVTVGPNFGTYPSRKYYGLNWHLWDAWSPSITAISFYYSKRTKLHHSDSPSLSNVFFRMYWKPYLLCCLLKLIADIFTLSTPHILK